MPAVLPLSAQRCAPTFHAVPWSFCSLSVVVYSLDRYLLGNYPGPNSGSALPSGCQSGLSFAERIARAGSSGCLRARPPAFLPPQRPMRQLAEVMIADGATSPCLRQVNCHLALRSGAWDSVRKSFT
jgi:hypothetical protein